MLEGDDVRALRAEIEIMTALPGSGGSTAPAAVRSRWADGARTWWIGARPKTLPSIFGPVGVGTALAYSLGQVSVLALRPHVAVRTGFRRRNELPQRL